MDQYLGLGKKSFGAYHESRKWFFISQLPEVIKTIMDLL